MIHVVMAWLLDERVHVKWLTILWSESVFSGRNWNNPKLNSEHQHCTRVHQLISISSKKNNQ